MKRAGLPCRSCLSWLELAGKENDVFKGIRSLHLILKFEFSELRVCFYSKVKQGPVLASLPHVAMLPTANVDLQAAKHDSLRSVES